MPRSVELAPARRSARRDGVLQESVAEFSVQCTRFLDAAGQPLSELPEFAHDVGKLVQLYSDMALTRRFEQRAVALQRTGRLGTYPSSYGQEATEVTIGAAMARDDVLLGTYRETGAMLVRGVEMTEILLYWGGDERGMNYSGPRAPRADFPICVPIATHATQAVGVAYALKLRREPRVAVCVLGDGATSKGDFYEALNAAGVWSLPLVFVVVNNGWAISVPREAQSRAQTLAQKAIAAGIEGEQVDGNDALAVYHVLERALTKARSGGGPHVVEALTYRLSDHTTADDARRYRTPAEVERHLALDPLSRLRGYLVRMGAWGESDETRMTAEHDAAVETAVAAYLATETPSPTAMFDHLFERLPAALEPQREAVSEEPQS